MMNIAAQEKLLQPVGMPIYNEQMIAWQEFGVLAKERIAEADNDDISHAHLMMFLI